MPGHNQGRVGWVVMLVCVIALIGVTVGLEVYAAWTGSGGPVAVPETFGNTAVKIDRLLQAAAPATAAFTFAVAGDIKSYGTFERFAERLRGEPLAFMTILGDATGTGTPGYHAYLRREIAGEWRLPFPVFYVVGNHDISSTDYTLAQWEADYGPSLFAFEFRDCLFIGLRTMDPPYPTAASLAFLEATLKTKREHSRRTFVFLHSPPRIEGCHGNDGFVDDADFRDLCRTYKVDYVFGGDYHGYQRITEGPTVYQTIGTGGAHLRDPYLTAHLVLLVTVGPDRVQEQLVSSPPVVDIADVIEQAAVTDVYPFMHRHWIAMAAVNAVLAMALGLAIRALIARFRKQETAA